MDLINLAVEEYDQSLFYKSTLRQLTPAEAYLSNGINLQLNLAVALVLGLMLSVFIVLFNSFMKEKEEGDGTK